MILFKTKFKEDTGFALGFNDRNGFGVDLDFTVNVGITDIPCYEGDYEVTPKVNAQILSTAKTFLKEDLTVKSIPFFKVSNTSGGNTIYIGNEV